MNNTKTLFHETQRFNKWWVWGLLVLIAASFAVSLYKNWSGWQSLVTVRFIVPFIVIILINALILLNKLETMIKQDGIYVRFFPFHFSFKRYQWQTQKEVYVRKYHPLSEYGGWGVRWGIAGKAFNISGKWGIQLVSKEGRRLLVGTQKAEDVRKVLDDVYRNNR